MNRNTMFSSAALDAPPGYIFRCRSCHNYYGMHDVSCQAYQFFSSHPLDVMPDVYDLVAEGDDDYPAALVGRPYDGPPFECSCNDCPAADLYTGHQFGGPPPSACPTAKVKGDR